MAGFERGSPQWGFTSYILLILFGALVFNTGPLDSDRPVQDNTGRQYISQLTVAPARLWEDPFESILKHRKTIQNKIKKIDLFNVHTNHDKVDPVHPFLIPDSTSERFKGTIKILGVMVNSGPYSEIVERRIRRRYAVISGLAEGGFIPDDSNFINYFHWHPGKSTNIDMYEFVPYEWFYNSGKDEYLMVLWLQDESFIHKPGEAFDNLVETFKGHRKRFDIKFIGPSTSTLLKKMVRLNNKEFPYSFLSPTATVPEEQLGGSLPANIVRTIATDDQVAMYLVRELQIRQPKQKRNKKSDKIESDNPEDYTFNKCQLVLISEHDTVFGRTMPHLIADKLGSNDDKSDDSSTCEQVRQYSYLRGIDGQTHDKSSLTPKKNSKDLAGQKNLKRQPVGSSQYDYLRRMAIRMRADERENIVAGKGGLRFIGIFGNDVYDKLLILQAIRSYFPGAVYFTTDLDARLLQDSEYKWTRNLVVASSFGLSLNKKRQGKIPPFRDSYQTSIFHTVLLALRSWNGRLDKERFSRKYRPLIYEVGRKGAVRIDLKLTDNAYLDDINPEEFTRPNKEALASIFFIFAAGIFAYYHSTLKKRRARYTRWFSVGWIFLALLTVLAYWLSFNQEPFSFTDGVSIWPTIYIRSLATILSIYLFFHAIRKLKNNYSMLSNNYFNETDCPGYEWDNTKHIWYFLLAAVGIFVSCMYFIDRHILLESIAAWSVLIGVYFYVISFRLKIRNIGYWAEDKTGSEEDADSKEVLPVSSHWCQYGEYGQPSDRVYRSLAFTMLYLSFSCILFMLLGAPNAPARGEYVFIIDKLILVPAVVSLMLLLFLIVDETRLCTTWIYKFVNQKIVWTQDGQKKLKHYDAAYHSYVSEWLNVQLIADRTQTVGRLLYYPFFIIVLMLLSRSTYFDNWSFPLPLVIIFGGIVLIAIFCSIRLRQVAEKARSEALAKLTAHIIGLTSKEVAPKAITFKSQGSDDGEPVTAPVTHEPKSIVTSEQKIKLIEMLIKDINNVNIGAFQPLRDQPFVRATIIVFGAAGLTITEYLRLSG
ncbi:FIG00857328: hypothetical protein [hydrothermal vent metagenome]|uniref:Uncharacterized protein n=1 Tax=hydrothermal vent metagenome TaxID=652676 RepID=A0A3B0ZGB5_9ZZZZ